MTNIVLNVQGNGQVYITINGVWVAQAYPDRPASVNIVNGDELGLRGYPYSGSSFLKICDPQNCYTGNPTYFTIYNDQDMPPTITTYFTEAPVYKWLCQSGVCMQSGDGIYDTQAQCQDNCAGSSLRLTVDKSNPAVGEVVTFKALVNKPDGTIINLYQQAAPLQQDFLIGTGTLYGGKCTIPHTFTYNGSTIQYACTPGLILACDLKSNLVPVKVGYDYITMALYAAGILAGAYLIGKVLDRRK